MYPRSIPLKLGLSITTCVRKSSDTSKMSTNVRVTVEAPGLAVERPDRWSIRGMGYNPSVNSEMEMPRVLAMTAMFRRETLRLPRSMPLM